MQPLLKQIQQKLKENAGAEAIEASKKFVPGTTKVYGVRMPVLNALAQEYKTGSFDLIKQLWAAGAFEEKILAIKILEKIAHKDSAQSLQLLQHFANGIDNWAVCDALGMQGLKKMVGTHQQEIFSLAKKYNRSKNLWQRRLSLVMVEWYTRDKAAHAAINELVAALEDDEEYYVKKAVQWINRNLKKGK
jgi:3-methyladenine DNA glycosylase AlkD